VAFLALMRDELRSHDLGANHVKSAASQTLCFIVKTISNRESEGRCGVGKGDVPCEQCAQATEMKGRETSHTSTRPKPPLKGANIAAEQGGLGPFDSSRSFGFEPPTGLKGRREFDICLECVYNLQYHNTTTHTYITVEVHVYPDSFPTGTRPHL